MSFEVRAFIASIDRFVGTASDPTYCAPFFAVSIGLEKPP
jgi:hypothetical protein